MRDMVIIGDFSDGEEDAIAVQSRVAGLETVVNSSLEVGIRQSRRSIGGQPIPQPMRALSPPPTTAKASTKRSPLGSSGNPNPLKSAQ